MDSTTSTTATAESKTQQYGYVRVYRAVMHECGPSAAVLYGILEDYVQLGARTGKGCVPSHDHLAKIMGCHRNTIITLMRKLRDTGWVEWEETGKANVYHLPTRKVHKNYAAPAQILGSTCTDSVHNQEQENKNKEQEPPLSPKGGVSPYSQDFQNFWGNYPAVTNNSKRKAWQAWQKLDAGEREAASSSMATFKASSGWRSGFAPHASTFLNGKLWEDTEKATPTSTSGSKNGHHPEERVDRRPAIQQWQPTERKSLSPEKLAEVRAMRRRTE